MPTSKTTNDHEVSAADGSAAGSYSDESPVVLWVTDAEGNCVFFSQAWYRLTGQTREEAMGHGWLDTVHPEDRDAVMRQFELWAGRREEHTVDYRVRAADGGYRWMVDTASPRFDENQAFVGFIGSSVDITERKAAEEELARTSSLLNTIFETAPIGLAVWDRDMRFVHVNHQLAELNGLEPAAHIGRRPDEILPDVEGLAGMMDAWRGILETGEPLHGVEIRGETPAAPGQQRVWRESFFPIRHEGQIIGLGAIVEEITGQKKAEEALIKSETRFRSLAEGIPQLVWRGNPDGSRSWSSPQWTDYTGQKVGESLGRGWLEMVHPDDRAIAEEANRGEQPTIASRAEYRIYNVHQDRHRWFQSRATPVAIDNSLAEWLGASTDVDEMRQMQEHQRILLSELQHRVRNTLAVIRSIARRTAETSASVEDYAMNFEGRIDAFARLQSMATRDPGRGIDLEQIISEELLSCAAQEGDQASISGPALKLHPKPAETFALAMHELATNAIKFGALSREGGYIDINWQLVENQDPPLLQFEWRERMQETPPPPKRRGFGSELLTRSLGYELQANVSHTFDDKGVRCLIEMPLTPRILAGTG